MSRTKGSLNKSKFCSILLSDLCQNLKPDARIPVSSDFARALCGANAAIKFEEIQNQTISNKQTSAPFAPIKESIQFSIT